MIVENKKILFLGDSITEGAGTTAPEYIYHEVIKNNLKLNTVYNCGIGGTRIAIQTTPTVPDTRFDLYFRLRAQVMPKDPDIVIVFGGTNDYGHGDAQMGDIDSNDDFTFMGALNNLILQLKKDYSNSKIIFLTPIHRAYEDVKVNKFGYVLKEYADSIIKICNKHNITVIDLFNEFDLDPFDINLVPDGLHPNDAGHKLLGDFISKKLLEL